MRRPRRNRPIHVRVATYGEVMDQMAAAGVPVRDDTLLMTVEWLRECAQSGAVLALAGLPAYFESLKRAATEDAPNHEVN